MEKIEFSLISDGSSDRCLLPILKWVIRRHFPEIPIEGKLAETSRLLPFQNTLSVRIRKTITFYQPDILFIHRDAETQDPQLRYDEILSAISSIGNQPPPYVCVVPVRMSEAWLLFDENAIRKAAGNPNGRGPVQLPPIRTLESIPYPKQMLKDILIQASELRGRHLKRFKPDKRRWLISENINDYSPLLALEAFRRLNRDIAALRSL